VATVRACGQRWHRSSGPPRQRALRETRRTRRGHRSVAKPRVGRFASRAPSVPHPCHNDMASHVTSSHASAASVLLRTSAIVNGQPRRDP
jgi:hypothetical protein